MGDFYSKELRLRAATIMRHSAHYSPDALRERGERYMIVDSSYTPNTSFITWMISPSVA